MEAIDYLELIDSKFKEARKKKISRMSIEWGKWSAEMNREIRKKLKKNPDDILLKYVFQYWENRSQLLNLFHKRFEIIRKIKLAREGERLRRIILNKS